MQVCKTTRRVLSQCPTLKVNLSDHFNSLRTMQEAATEKATEQGLNKKQIKLALDAFKYNLERIKDTIMLADQSMKATNDQFKKIRNAMMW